MSIKSVFLILLFLLPFSFFSQQGEYLKANGVIKNIEKKRSGKKIRENSNRIFLQPRRADTIETIVELERFSFFWVVFKSVGDKSLPLITTKKILH
jgi:hypothetical protein